MFLDLQVPGYIISPKQIQSNISRFNTINIILVSHLALEKNVRDFVRVFYTKNDYIHLDKSYIFCTFAEGKKNVRVFCVKIRYKNDAFMHNIKV